MSSRFDSAEVLVTGAAQGIGLETARTFVELGARVWMVDMNDEALEKASSELGPVAVAFRGDLAEEGHRGDLIAALRRDCTRLDVLVNNAGPPMSDSRAREDFGDGIVRSLGIYGAMCRLVQPLMTRGGGAIVNVASIAGMVGLGSDWYAAAKAGVIGLTVRLAVEFGPIGTRVNAVAPGVIATPRTSAMSSAALTSLSSAVPLRRIGSPQEVAAVIAFLASSDASYVNGSVIKVDGGLECAPAWAGSSAHEGT